MIRRVFKLVHDQARQLALQLVKAAPEGWVVIVQEPTRSLDANAAMWPILQAFSEQLVWPVNGQMVKLSADEWKDLLSAAFKREEARICPGINGGMVMLGHRTSQFSKREFSDFLEFLHSVASDRGVMIYQDREAA